MQENIHYIEMMKNAIENGVFTEKEMQKISWMGAREGEWLFDFRAVLLRPEILNAYSEIFWEKYKDIYPFQVCGIETAAISLVSAIVMKSYEKRRPVNGFFIRKSRKKSGLFRMVEGQMTSDPIIIIDDLINTGASIIHQIEILKEAGKRVKEIFSILRFRDVRYYEYFNNNLQVSSLFELNDFRDTLGIVNVVEPEKRDTKNSFLEREVVWTFTGESPNFFYVFPKSGPVVSGNKIYFGTDNGIFFALNIADGKEVWRYKVPFGDDGKFIFSTPVIYKDMVFFGAYDGNLYALDKDTGKRKWVFMEAEWIGSSPCVAEDPGMVFVGLEYGLFKKQGGVCGIDAKNGEKIWEFRSEEYTHGSPAYSRKFSVVGCGSNDGLFSLLDAKTGKFLWNFQTGGSIKYAPCFADKYNVVIVLGLGDIVYVLKTKTGEIVSSYKMGFGGYSTPLVWGDKVICTSLDKKVHCFNILSGELVWEYNTGARCFATPEIVNGKIYVGSNNARLFEMNPDTGEVSGTFHTRERIVNKIAYDPRTRIIFVPTFANEIIAIKENEKCG